MVGADVFGDCSLGNSLRRLADRKIRHRSDGDCLIDRFGRFCRMDPVWGVETVKSLKTGRFFGGGSCRGLLGIRQLVNLAVS
jgi:hypothetical protein